MSEEMFRAQTKFYQLVKLEGAKDEGGEGGRPSAGVK